MMCHLPSPSYLSWLGFLAEVRDLEAACMVTVFETIKTSKLLKRCKYNELIVSQFSILHKSIVLEPC